MRAKVEAAGVALRSCGEPFYDAANSLVVRCFTAATPTEQVALATFERPASGADSAQMLETNGKLVVHREDGWLIAATSVATLGKMRTALDPAS